LIPDTARAGPIDAVDSLRNDALGTKSARMGGHGRPTFGAVLVKQYACLGVDVAELIAGKKLHSSLQQPQGRTPQVALKYELAWPRPSPRGGYLRI
jgi:hypothetical protein